MNKEKALAFLWFGIGYKTDTDMSVTLTHIRQRFEQKWKRESDLEEEFKETKYSKELWEIDLELDK